MLQIGGLVKTQETEISQLRKVGPKKGYRDFKMLAVAIPALPIVGLQMAGAFDSYLATLDPGTATFLRLPPAAVERSTLSPRALRLLSPRLSP